MTPKRAPCPSCGKRIEADRTWCYSCDTDLAGFVASRGADNADTPTQPGIAGKKAKRLLAGGLILAVCGAALLFAPVSVSTGLDGSGVRECGSVVVPEQADTPGNIEELASALLSEEECRTRVRIAVGFSALIGSVGLCCATAGLVGVTARPEDSPGGRS